MIISLIALLVIAAFPAFRTALEGLYNDITAGFTSDMRRDVRGRAPEPSPDC